MKKPFLSVFPLAVACAVLILGSVAGAQNQQSAAGGRGSAQVQVMNLTDYGVALEPDKRLIVMMAALDAAGFDPTPNGATASAFRQQVRRDQANLDPDLKRRLQDYFERNKLHATGTMKPTAADDAARYISLALSLGPVPQLDSPSRSDDLPGELLEVLDFAPLVREFYRRSGIEERLPNYFKLYQNEGDNMRRPTQELVHSVLSYLHTQPITKRMERIETTSPGTGKRKGQIQRARSFREHERTFFLTPDLLAVPGSINFRGIGDDYYVIIPFNADPRSSEVRRAYLEYVMDPLVVRFNKDITERRDQIKGLLAKRLEAGSNVTPDIRLAVSRSLVAATDAKMEVLEKLQSIDAGSRNRLAVANKSKDPVGERNAILKNQAELKRAVDDEMVAQLSDAYEQGAVLSFYFAEQLNGVETSGFDIANSFADMIASFDPAKEGARLEANASTRKRALETRKERAAALAKANANPGEPGGERRRALFNSLGEVEELLRVKNYTEAETRLKALMVEFQQEPRIFFALGQAASLSAQDAFDENLQAERLGRALFNYRSAIQWASPESDSQLISRAHAASGRILVFMDKRDDAMKEFDAVIAMGAQADERALRDAKAGKVALGNPK